MTIIYINIYVCIELTIKRQHLYYLSYYLKLLLSISFIAGVRIARSSLIRPSPPHPASSSQRVPVPNPVVFRVRKPMRQPLRFQQIESILTQV